MKRSLPILIFLAAFTLGGCTSYRHARFDAESGKPIEETSLRAPFLTKSTISGLKSRVSDKHGTNVYTRTVGVETAESRTDAEGVDAMGRLVGTLLLQALQASGAGPAAPLARVALPSVAPRTPPPSQ